MNTPHIVNIRRDARLAGDTGLQMPYTRRLAFIRLSSSIVQRKGDRTECGNYIGITLLPVPFLLYNGRMILLL